MKQMRIPNITMLTSIHSSIHLAEAPGNVLQHMPFTFKSKIQQHKNGGTMRNKDARREMRDGYIGRVDGE